MSFRYPSYTWDADIGLCLHKSSVDPLFYIHTNTSHIPLVEASPLAQRWIIWLELLDKMLNV